MYYKQENPRLTSDSLDIYLTEKYSVRKIVWMVNSKNLTEHMSNYEEDVFRQQIPRLLSSFFGRSIKHQRFSDRNWIQEVIGQIS